MWQILTLHFQGSPPVYVVPFLCRLTVAGAGRGFFTCHSAKRTARSGGRIARTLSPAKTTGIRAGTGQQVGGLCGASPGRVTAACLVSGARSPNCSCQWGCGLQGGQVTIQQLRCSDGLWAVTCSSWVEAHQPGVLAHGVFFSGVVHLQEQTAVLGAPCADPSAKSSPTQKTCVRRSGPTPSNTPQSAGAAGAASRCGSTLPMETPTWLWQSTMLGKRDPRQLGGRT